MQKLLDAGIIKRIDYPRWLANPVVVPNQDREWRICMNYTGLNKEIPKRPFPLPCIDQVVDVVVGHEALYFLNVYKQPLIPWPLKT